MENYLFTLDELVILRTLLIEKYNKLENSLSYRIGTYTTKFRTWSELQHLSRLIRKVDRRIDEKKAKDFEDES